MVDSLSTMGAAFEDIGRGLVTIDDGGWRGSAAEAFHDRFDQHHKRFLTAADAFGAAAVVLDDYASALSWAQRQATEAAAFVDEDTEPAAAPPLTMTQLGRENVHVENDHTGQQVTLPRSEFVQILDDYADEISSAREAR